MHDDPAKAALAETSAPHAKPPKDAGPSVGGIPTMRVKIRSPARVYFDEAAVSLSAQNLTGQFDILPRHHNFITLLVGCELEIARPGRLDKQRIKISGGLMHVKSDMVTVFLNV